MLALIASGGSTPSPEADLWLLPFYRAARATFRAWIPQQRSLLYSRLRRWLATRRRCLARIFRPIVARHQLFLDYTRHQEGIAHSR
jgi:hypothetical protein